MQLYSLVGPPGLEPGTHSLKGCRSNRLSYGPILIFLKKSVLNRVELYQTLKELSIFKYVLKCEEKRRIKGVDNQIKYTLVRK
jgi:hypothetical protein